MFTLEELGAEALYLLADDMSDEEHDRVAAMPSADRIRHFYVSGECDAFAVAMHRISGWPIVAVSSPKHGPVHRLVMSPEGRMLDASGWIDEKALERRYRFGKLTYTAPGGEELASSTHGVDADGVDRQIACAVAAIRQLPWAPFSEDNFRTMSGRPVEGADPISSKPAP